MRRSLLFIVACATSVQAQWKLERVASTVDDIDIGWIASFAAGRDGSLYVADGKLQQIVVYDSTGHRARTIGRKGSGPLEFRSLANIAWLGDTLVANDGAKRVTFIHPNGTLVRMVLWQAAERPNIWLGPGGPYLYVVAYGRGRTEPIPGVKGGSRNIRPPKTVLRIGDTTASPLRWASDSTTDNAGWECWHDPAQTIYGLDERPGGNGPFDAVTTRGDLVYLSPDRSRIFMQSPSQRPRAAGQPYAPVQVTDAIWTREAKEYIETEKKEGKLTCSPLWIRPTTLAPIRAIAADDAGGFWVEVTTASGSRYDVYDAGGRHQGSVEAPARRVPQFPFVVRGDKLYVAERDPSDVIGVTAYRLKR